MRVYLEEAALLAAEASRTGCPVSDTAAFLDRHPEVRLVLEDTWSDPFGRIYRDVAADHQSRWPAHIARTFRTFLRIGRNPGEVFRLLDLLHELDADGAVIRMVIARCRRVESLVPTLEYLERLATELRAVTEACPDEEISLGVAEPRCHPCLRSGTVSAGSWYLPESCPDEDAPRVEHGCYRPELLHDPNSVDSDDGDWVESQPRSWRRLYRAIYRADAGQLADIRERLLVQGKACWNHDQLAVLWTAYHRRRALVRQESQRVAARQLGITARKLVQRVRRIRTEKEAGWVGYNLHRAMKGEIPLPGVVSEAEWSIVFAVHRARKSELGRGDVAGVRRRA